MNLKKAIEENKLDQFITERKHIKGDSQAFRKALKAICQKNKVTQETSSQDFSENCTDIQTP